MEKAKKITVIPVNPRYDYKAICEIKRIRRAAYARVSTDKEEQLTSYKAQCQYYTEKLSKMENTEFVGLYADEGLSGTSVKRRKQFLKLIEDCEAGLIDEVWVKSISRFSRNIVDCVQYIRRLKALGINIHFESINIDTMDSKGELLIIILASIAEEESRNISENIRWRLTRDFANGKMMVSNIYGYRKDEFKQLVINPDTAPVVRQIFKDYLNGYTANQIAEQLNTEGVPTFFEDSKWQAASIMRMLNNEKYKGDALLQKTYSKFMVEGRKKNVGQEKMYQVENSHPPIVSRDLFDKVQAEIKRRTDLAANGERIGGKYSHRHAFSGRIKCGECGDMYRRWQYEYNGIKTPMWICKTKQTSKKQKCIQPQIAETVFEQAFVTVLNSLIGNKEDFLNNFMETASQIITEKDQVEYNVKATELETARDEMLELDRAKAKKKINDTEYYDASLKLMDKIDELTAETRSITEIINAKKTVKHRLEDIRTILEGDILNGFDETVFRQLVAVIIVRNSRELEFVFHCGITDILTI